MSCIKKNRIDLTKSTKPSRLHPHANIYIYMVLLIMPTCAAFSFGHINVSEPAPGSDCASTQSTTVSEAAILYRARCGARSGEPPARLDGTRLGVESPEWGDVCFVVGIPSESPPPKQRLQGHIAVDLHSCGANCARHHLWNSEWCIFPLDRRDVYIE